jgi:hypothetical protein
VASCPLPAHLIVLSGFTSKLDSIICGPQTRTEF